MKKLKIAAAVLAIAATAGIAGCTACGKDNKPPAELPPVTVTINTTQTSVTIKDYLVEGYNFARYFRISDDGKSVSPAGYIDVSALKPIAGEYLVTCNYKDYSSSIKVKVEASDSKFNLSKTEIRLNTAEL